MPNCPSSEVSACVSTGPAVVLDDEIRELSYEETYPYLCVSQSVVVLIMTRVRKLLWSFAGIFRLSGSHYCVASSKCRPQIAFVYLCCPMGLV